MTLHLSRENSRYWAVDQEKAIIFCHPTLESLTLSCADIGNGVVEELKEKPRTPLKRLVTVECNLTPTAFASIIALPAALKHLSLGKQMLLVTSCEVY